MFQIIPSIDIYNGKVVRLTNGSFDNIQYYDESPIEYVHNLISQGYERIHIVDLNGAKAGKPNIENWDEIHSIVDYATKRGVTVDAGGGIRNMNTVDKIFNRYDFRNKLFKMNFGSACYVCNDIVSILSYYGFDRFVLSFDIDENGYVLINGWTDSKQISFESYIERYIDYGVKDFIITTKSTDGTLNGFAFEQVNKFERLKQLIKDKNINISISGGCRGLTDIYNLKKSGFSSCIVGKAIATGNINLDTWKWIDKLNPQFNIIYEDQNLIPVIVQDSRTYKVLMRGYMNFDALVKTLEDDNGHVTFYSRSRQTIWTKGETSGHYLDVRLIKSDCDNDTLLIYVDPNGPVCHTGNDTCFGEKNEDKSMLYGLYKKIDDIKNNRIESSGYTKKLLGSNSKVEKKIVEEAGELIIESLKENKERIVYECADLLYNTIVMLAKHNITLEDIEDELRNRESKDWTKHE